MRTSSELFTKLKSKDTVLRRQALKEALALSMQQKLELCSLFEMTTDICDAINCGNDVFVLDNWSDSMITFYFQIFNEYIRSLEGQIISLNLESIQTHNCAYYDGPDVEQDCFEDILDWGLDNFEWVKKEFHEHPILQISNMGMRLVQCLIEDSSCLSWLSGVYLLNCVHCTFQSLDCRYLRPHGSIGDGESPHFFFESCSFESIEHLESIYGSLTFGLTYSTVKAPLKIPKSEENLWPLFPTLALAIYVDLLVEQRQFGVLSLLGEEGKDYSWLKGAEIIDLVVSWRTLHTLWPSIKDNPPKIKALTIVLDNDVQMYSNTLSELPNGIEKCGIEILMSDSALQDFEDTPKGIQTLMKMYAQLPNLKYVFFPYALEQGNAPTNGVWLANVPWPEEEYLEDIPFEAPAMRGEYSIMWNGLGFLSWHGSWSDVAKTGLSLDLEATKRQLAST